MPIRNQTGPAYGMPAPTFEADLVRVGPGTPGGEVLRRYWIPVALAAEVEDVPLAIRALGEDLVLFRTGSGEYGMIYPRCIHRGADMRYGKIDVDGIACCYHGWKFAPDGRCLAQPCEPTFDAEKYRVRQPWYPVREQYGLIFAYMGPLDRKPPLPRYDVFEDLAADRMLQADGDSLGSGGPDRMPCNWFQTHENVMDPAHVSVLHQGQFPPEMAQAFAENDFDVSEGLIYGHAAKTLPNGMTMRMSAELVFPNIRIIPDPFLTGMGRAQMIGWTLPIDDHMTRIFTVLNLAKDQVRVHQRDIAAYDGKTWHQLTLRQHQQFPGDFEAQVGQGVITFHSEEHLATSDKGVVAFRNMFRAAIRAVQDGGDAPMAFGRTEIYHCVRASVSMEMASA